MTTGGRIRDAVGRMLLQVLTVGFCMAAAGLTAAVAATPLDTTEDVVHPTSDQVLRRLAAWLDSEESRRMEQRRALDSIREQMDRVALELERIETKMDLKMDRLQEVLIGRDIKEDATSRRQELQLEQTTLRLTEVSERLHRLDSNFKDSLDVTNQKLATLEGQVKTFQTSMVDSTTRIEQAIMQQPAANDVIAEWTSDVTPALQRLADGVERLHCQDGFSTAAGADETHAETTEDTEERGDGVTESHGHGESSGGGTRRTEERALRRAERIQVKGFRSALKLLGAMEQLELQIFSVSDQLNEGLGWLDERVGHKFRGLKEDLATMASSLRNRFFERRDHLEEVAAKILRLLAASAESSGRGSGSGGGGTEAVPLDNGVVTALEGIIYDIFDTDLWFMLSTKLEEAVNGQGNITAKLGQVDKDMHQGFSKLYAQLTRLSYELVKAPHIRAQESSVDRVSTEMATQMTHMFSNISSQLHDIHLKLDDRQAT